MNRITTVWFDLDATLYSAESGLWAQIGNRIESYMQNILGFPHQQMLKLKMDYYHRYGTTLRGLQLHNGVDTHQYLEYVHDIPVSDYIQADPALRRMLLKLPLNRLVFTNSDRAHALRVLNALDIADCFHGLITVESIHFQNKPNSEAYRTALKISGETEFDHVLFLDDSTRNLEGARDLGVHTILVGTEKPHHSAEFSIRRPHDLEIIMPELFQPQR